MDQMLVFLPSYCWNCSWIIYPLNRKRPMHDEFRNFLFMFHYGCSFKPLCRNERISTYQVCPSIGKQAGKPEMGSVPSVHLVISSSGMLGTPVDCRNFWVWHDLHSHCIMHIVYILMCQPTLKPEIAAITAQNVIYLGNPRSSDLLWVFDCVIVALCWCRCRLKIKERLADHKPR